MKIARLLVVIPFLCCASLALGQANLPAVFVANNVGHSVTSFTVNPDGSLNRIGVFPSGEGPQTISLTPDGRFLAVGHGTQSQVTEELRIFRVNPDATLTHMLTTHVPDSPLDVQWLNSSVLAVTETRLGGPNQVRTFNYDAGANMLNLVDTKPTGSFNTRLATTRGGSLLYANNTSGGNSIFAYAAAPGGQMTLVQNAATSPLFAVDVAVSNDGKFLYGSGGISGSGREIMRFAIEPDGSLTQLPGFQSPGQSPKVIDLTDDDTILVAGHGTDSTFRTFVRNPVTGEITFSGHSFVAGQFSGQLGDLQVMGNLLFVTHRSSDNVGPAGIWSFTLHPDGSFTQNGPIMDTLGARPEYIATWIPEPAALSVLAASGLLLMRRRG